jgi:hypothetical protein
MNSSFRKLLLVLSVACGVFAFSSSALAGPTLDKTTVIIRANTYSQWDSKANTDRYGWVPQLDFSVNGPVPSGSVISFEMTTPDGKPWVSADCETSTVGVGEVLKVEACGRDLQKTKSLWTSAVGMFGLKISIKNELQGMNQDFFSGKFKVSKIFYGDVPNDKNNYAWYVDYDWALPIAELFPDAIEQSYGGPRVKDRQPLVVTFWFRGSTANSIAYLFYKGQQIGSTETTSDGMVVGEQGVELIEKANVPIAWVKNKYIFTHVLVENRDNSGMEAFRLEKNPGEYEVKVLRKGKLVRDVKFTVGPNGRIVDPGVTQQNALGTQRITVFAAVTGDEDGRKPDLAAWKTGAFFGEPLKGFGNN